MKSTENKSTSSCPAWHKDADCSKPAAADATKHTGKPCWGLRALLGYWDGYPPLQTHSLLCLEEESKYMHYCCLLSQMTAELSELTSHDCSSSADFCQIQGYVCQGRDRVARHILPQRLPQVPQHCSEMTRDLPDPFCSL